MQNDNEPITLWLDQMKHGDLAAAEKLWDRYSERIVAIGQRLLRDAPRRAADEDDVALSAFRSFWRRATEGQFPHLDDRESLWRLLLTITVRKSLKQARRERIRAPVNGSEAFLNALESGDVGSEFWPTLQDTLNYLCVSLEDDTLRDIAIRRMQGFKVREIADHVGCSVPTVERKLRLIRKVWSEE